MGARFSFESPSNNKRKTRSGKFAWTKKGKVNYEKHKQ